MDREPKIQIWSRNVAQFISFHLNGHTLGFHPQYLNVRNIKIDLMLDSGSQRVKKGVSGQKPDL